MMRCIAERFVSHARLLPQPAADAGFVFCPAGRYARRAAPIRQIPAAAFSATGRPATEQFRGDNAPAPEVNIRTIKELT